eukprot:3674557-Amphidinium_carterae.1
MASRQISTAQRREDFIREKLEMTLQSTHHHVWREGLRGEAHAREQKLYRKNQEQKYKAIWIGRDTATGQHITLTEEFAMQLSRTVLSRPKEQQVDRDLLLKVTSTTGEYDNSKKKKTDKDIAQLFNHLRAYNSRNPLLLLNNRSYHSNRYQKLQHNHHNHKYKCNRVPTASATTTSQRKDNNQNNTCKERLVGDDGDRGSTFVHK